jgi:FixJ family two-component response regulator
MRLCSIAPGEPSEKLALHVKALRLPVVMISGSMESMIFADEHGLQLLEKPVRLPELLDAINKAISRVRPARRVEVGVTIKPTHYLIWHQAKASQRR